MAQTGTPNTSSLLRPLGAQGVLIKGEKIKYNERKHWAELIRPFIETLLVLSFITGFARGVPTGTLGATLVIGALVMFFVERRRYDWSSRLLYLVVAGLLLGFWLFRLERMAIILIALAAGRFIYVAAMWAFYTRLYITNRRIIMASGFLGAQISTMPLTRVTDISFRTTVPGELLGYGILRVETAGQDQALSLIDFLDDPSNFYELLIDLSTAAVGSVTKDDEETPSPPDKPAESPPHAVQEVPPDDEGSGTRDYVA